VTRDSGVLLHLTSLPDGEGIGDLGPAAFTFVDWLVEAGQSWWQVLPCGEVGYGASPYQSQSAYAGNSLLISLQGLIDLELYDQEQLESRWVNTDAVDFAAVASYKEGVLGPVCENFERNATTQLYGEYQEFIDSEEQHWLHDYARFVVLKKRFEDKPWTDWPEAFARRDGAALYTFDVQEATALESVKVRQFLFASQWQALRTYANNAGIQLLGDCPIYVAADSADVWSHPELFDLAEDGSPRVVAGVPPDYFSATGQLWGNPLYLWDRAAADGYAWWRARVKHFSQQFDLTRIDHFRGLDEFWEVPGDAPDASSGCWQPGPGAKFLEHLQLDYAALPLVAEDLGDLTPAVHLLREQFELPGMRVLQFGFDGGADNPHAPERITADVICYAGTHDNNTTMGWLAELGPEQLEALTRRYQQEDLPALVDAILDEALCSPAELAVLTMQDLLCLPATARFNTPGTVGNNWHWRLKPDQLTADLARSLSERCLRAGRQSAGGDDHIQMEFVTS